MKMQKTHNWQLICILPVILLAGCRAEQPPPPVAAADPENPIEWEADIAAFEARDSLMAPPENAFLFIGSSSIRLWKTLAEDMDPLPVIQRGFGGSKLGDAIYYIDRIVTPYAPRAIVMFSGTNDIAGDSPKPPERVFSLYKQFVGEVQRKLPGTPIFFIAITPTWARWEHKDLVARTNALVEAHTVSNPLLYFIDTASAVLDENGEPRKDLFVEDQLHLNEQGYAVWTSIIKPALIESIQPEMAVR